MLCTKRDASTRSRAVARLLVEKPEGRLGPGDIEEVPKAGFVVILCKNTRQQKPMECVILEARGEK